MDRDGGDHDAVHHTIVSLPADRLTTGAEQRPARVRPRERTARRAARTDTGCRPRARGICRRRHTWLRLRAAVERLRAARAEIVDERRSCIPGLEDHPRRHSGHEPQSAHRRAVGHRSAVAADSAESLLRHHSALIVAGESDHHARTAAQAVSAVHDRESVSQQRRHDSVHRGHGKARAAVVARPVLSGELHAVPSRGRCLIGVRCIDSDRPSGELSGGRQFRSQSRAGCVERRHSSCLRRVSGVGHPVGIRARA